MGKKNHKTMSPKKGDELSTIVQLVSLSLAWQSINSISGTTFSFPCAEALPAKRNERLWGQVTSMYI